MDDPAFLLQLAVTVLIGIIGIYYQRKQVALMRPDAEVPKVTRLRHWPLVFVVILAASSWIPYFLRPDDLPSWPSPKSYIVGYSAGPGECNVVVNGDMFMKYRRHYRLASACYIYDGVGDIADAPQLQASQAHEIREGQIVLRAKWGPGFEEFLEEKNATMINHVVLMLPIGVDPGQFSTMRQAINLGVRAVSAGAGAISRIQIVQPEHQ